MIEGLLKILDSFKENKISGLIQSVRVIISTKLQEKYFSSRAQSYFAEIEDYDQPYLDFEAQPKQVVQLKQLVNALYHAEKAFIDLETVNLRDWRQWVGDLTKLYFTTISQAYQASYLLTHLDFELTEVFGDEINQLNAILKIIQNYAAGYEKEASDIATIITTSPLSYNTGLYTGIAIDQMQPQHVKVDYRFLTRFGARHIQKLTLAIQEYCTQDPALDKPTIDQIKMKALEENVIKLLGAINELHDHDFLVFLRALNYISIIRHMITLATSIIEQVGHMNEISQNAARDNLAKLKYQMLPELFSFIDRLEAQAMLAPGTLSAPLMKQVKFYYNTLINYAQKPINFTIKGQDLLQLEDQRFMALRLKKTWDCIATANRDRLTAEQFQQAFLSFYHIIEKADYRDKRLVDLPAGIKTTLAQHYHYMQLIVEQYNPDLNSVILNGLVESKSWSQTLKTPYNWYHRYRDTDYISNLLAEKNNLTDIFNRNLATAQFTIELNRDIINHAHMAADIPLMPCGDRQIFVIDEQTALQLNEEAGETIEFSSDTPDCVIVVNPLVLTSAQSLRLYLYYDEKRAQLKPAIEAWQGFIRLLADAASDHLDFLHEIKEPAKTELAHLYSIFQPYFVSLLADEAMIIELDTTIAASLSPSNPDLPAPQSLINIKQITDLQFAFEQNLTAIDLFYQQQFNTYLDQTKQDIDKAIKSQPLAVNHRWGNRAHHLIKHRDYSQTISSYQKSLLQLTAALNLSARNKLIPQSSGLPYPALEDSDKYLAETQQTLNIKRLFNALYHLQEAFIQLEKLSNKSWESEYVYHLVKTYDHLELIYQLSKSLFKDHYFRLLTHDLMNKAYSLYGAVEEQLEPHLAINQEMDEEHAVKQSSIWYAIQAFTLIPAQIKSLNEQNLLSEQTLADIQKNADTIEVKVNALINQSDSYFKLLLQTPVMYGLFKELKGKLSNFAAISHDAIMAHLDDINTGLLTRILLETDVWETRLGLKPGTFSDEMKTILDQFYQGLVQPLGLISQTHLQLITSMAPIEQRQEALEKAARVATLRQDRITPQLVILKNLQLSLKSYLRFNHFLPSAQVNLVLLKKELLQHFEEALPILQGAEHTLPTPVKGDNQHPEIDDLLHDAHTHDQPKVTNVVALTRRLTCFFQGLSANCQFEIDTLKEQGKHLKKVKDAQAAANQQVIAKYKDNAFIAAVDTIINQKIGLLYIHDEYNLHFKAYLQTFKDEIIANTADSNDIRQTIIDLLMAKARLYHQNQLADYQKLDRVLGALARFKIYIDGENIAVQENASFFESKITLDNKTVVIEELEQLTRNTKLTVEERINKLKEKAIVYNYDFKSTLLAYQHYDSLSFKNLYQCFLGLLSSLGVYTSTREKRYQGIVESIKDEPQPPSFQGYGFFTQPKKERSYDLPPAEEPTPG